MAAAIDRRERAAFNLIGGFLIGLIAVVCLIPFLLIVSGSFSSEAAVIQSGYSVLPKGATLNAYRSIFKSPERIALAYRNTILYTVTGTGIGLFLTAMTGYVLSRKDFAWRNFFSMFFYFTTLFSGGLIPTYLLMISLGMKNNPLAVVMPSLLSVFNILLMRNFMSSIPDAITESAKIDGANDFGIFVRLILPLTKPALATIGLFMALGYWNSWYSCMLYITDYRLFTLQYYLYNILNQANEIKRIMEMGGTVNPGEMLPQETVKLAMTCVATGPILLLYPFVQRYFVKGITIGAVKG